MNSLSFCFLFIITTIGMSISPGYAQHTSEHGHQAISIIAEDYAFQAPDEIPSGWTTIRYTNKGNEPHILFLGRMPDGLTMENYATEFYETMNEAWYAVRDEGVSRPEAIQKLNLPDWFGLTAMGGGIGITAPGRDLEVTLNLKPGTYVLDCYMKTPDGEFHNMEGMMREMKVSDVVSDTKPPGEDIMITLSNHQITIDGELTPGNHTVAVHAADFGHNVHVARLEPNTEAKEVEEWMDWLNPEGLLSPAPAEFVGGLHRLQEGDTGYFTLDLIPGRYLFISQFSLGRDVWQEIFIE